MERLTGIFGFKKVYRNQVENVVNKIYTYWPENANFGYFGGGYIGPASGSYNSRLDFSTDVITELTKLTTTTAQATGISSKKYGYVIGGITGTAPGVSISTVQRVDFSTDSISNPGKNFSYPSRGRSAIQSVNYGEYGYLAGGTYPSPIYDCYIVRFDLSSESFLFDGNGLTTPRFYGAGSNSYISGYGYVAGGESPQMRSSIDRLDFSTNVSSLIPGILTASVSNFCGTQNLSYGYFAGGFTGPPFRTYSNIWRIDFTTESVTESTPFPTGNTARQAAVTSNTHGYFGAGAASDGGNPADVTTIWKFNYATETLTGSPNAFNGAGRYCATGYGASR